MLFIRAHRHFNIHTTPPIQYHHPIPLSIHLHIHLPARTLAPVALNPPFHWWVHNLCAHHSYSIDICRFLCTHTLLWLCTSTPSKTTSQATTRSTTHSGILALVPRGALCTAGVAMLGSASSSYWWHAIPHPIVTFPSIFALKALLSRPTPPSICHGLFRRFTSSVWPLGFFIPPGFRQFSPLFIGIHRHFTNTLIFAQVCPYLVTTTHHRPFGRFFSSYAPSAIVYLPCVHPTTPLFSPTSSNFQVFRVCVHLLWSLPPTWGCHHPPQSTGHPSHPPAGLVPLSGPLPIDFYQSHTQSVLSGSGKPPIGPLPPVCAPCAPPSIHPSIHPSTCPV